MSLKRFADKARSLLSEDPAKHRQLERVLNALKERKLPLPIVHFTSRVIQLPDGSTVPTGFIESILSAGLRARDTNVGAFVSRGQRGVQLADPAELDPIALLAQALILVSRYLKHGLRVNKDCLGAARGQGKGLPVVIIASPTGARLRRGSDFDDHYVVDSGLAPEAILGVVEIEAADMDPSAIAMSVLAHLHTWLANNNPMAAHDARSHVA